MGTNPCVDFRTSYGDPHKPARSKTLVPVNAHPAPIIPSSRRRSGFTLIEIMAVMAVIAILLSVAAVGIQNIDRGQATTTALSLTEALFDEARSKAVGQGTRARLLIHKNLDDNDPTDRERYLNYMCVAIQDNSQTSTNPQQQGGSGWEVTTPKLPMPGGVYFSIEESEKVADAIRVGRPGTMFIELPGQKGTPKECYYFEFNSEGVCVDSEGNTEPGAAVVLISGSRPRDQEKPKILKNNKVGFVVWRNGRTSIFRSPKQIDRAAP